MGRVASALTELPKKCLLANFLRLPALRPVD